MNRYIPNRHRGRQKIAKGGDERLFGDFRVRVILPEQKPILWRTHAKPGHGYSAKNIEEMLDNVAEHLEKRFPSIEFRMVELAPNAFNFIYEGRKETMTAIQTCPDVAQSTSVATELCAKQGHDINTFQNGMRVTQQGQQMEVATYCKKCGFGLSEIRGAIEQQIQAAVAQERAEQAMADAKQKAAQAQQQHKPKGPIELPRTGDGNSPEIGKFADSPSEAAPE